MNVYSLFGTHTGLSISTVIDIFMWLINILILIHQVTLQAATSILHPHIRHPILRIRFSILPQAGPNINVKLKKMARGLQNLKHAISAICLPVWDVVTASIIRRLLQPSRHGDPTVTMNTHTHTHTHTHIHTHSISPTHHTDIVQSCFHCPVTLFLPALEVISYVKVSRSTEVTWFVSVKGGRGRGEGGDMLTSQWFANSPHGDRSTRLGEMSTKWIGRGGRLKKIQQNYRKSHKGVLCNKDVLCCNN